MSKSKDSQRSEFSLEGRFLGFELEDGYKFKRMHVATSEGEFWIKLTKESRASVVSTFMATGRVLSPGDWIHVSGEKKLDGKTGVEKLKAYAIAPTTPGSLEAAPEKSREATACGSATKPKATILVCQKSDCMKRGGRAVCQALESTLRDRGLTDQVEIKGTGCMKHCKAGPNMVVMPGKARYSRIHPESVSTIIDQHFPPVDGEPDVNQAQPTLAPVATTV